MQDTKLTFDIGEKCIELIPSIWPGNMQRFERCSAKARRCTINTSARSDFHSTAPLQTVVYCRGTGDGWPLIHVQEKGYGNDENQFRCA
jgi:hypothetical protein